MGETLQSDAACTGASPKLGAGDLSFLVLLALALAAVVLSGRFAYHQGMLLETAKANAQSLVQWAESVAGQGSGDKDGSPLPMAVCAEPGATVPGAASDKALTWSACREVLFSADGPLGDLVNPFGTLNLVSGSRCERKTPSARGLVVLEKGTPSPPGLPPGMTWAGLADEEPLVRGLMLRVQVCDGGGYPLRIAELKL